MDKFFYFETPGNLLKYLLALKDSNFNISRDRLPCILFLIDKYKTKKDIEMLDLITLLNENLYNKLSLRDRNNINNSQPEFIFLDSNSFQLIILSIKIIINRRGR